MLNHTKFKSNEGLYIIFLIQNFVVLINLQIILGYNAKRFENKQKCFKGGSVLNLMRGEMGGGFKL